MCALSGTIGQSASVDFSAFLRLEKDLPVFTDIITSPMSAKIPEQKSAQLMLMFQAVDKMDNSATLTSFMKYLNRIESNEMQAVFFSMITLNSKTVKIARNNPEIAKWAKENHYLF